MRHFGCLADQIEVERLIPWMWNCYTSKANKFWWKSVKPAILEHVWQINRKEWIIYWSNEWGKEDKSDNLSLSDNSRREGSTNVNVSKNAIKWWLIFFIKHSAGGVRPGPVVHLHHSILRSYHLHHLIFSDMIKQN